jgi:hypothetical protein
MRKLDEVTHTVLKAALLCSPAREATTKSERYEEKEELQ